MVAVTPPLLLLRGSLTLSSNILALGWKPDFSLTCHDLLPGTISLNSCRACEVRPNAAHTSLPPGKPRSLAPDTRQPARENDVVICLRADGARVTSVVGTGRRREDGEFMRISRPAPRLLSQLIWRWCWWTCVCRCLPPPSSPPCLLLDSSLDRMIAPQTLVLKPCRGRT